MFRRRVRETVGCVTLKLQLPYLPAQLMFILSDTAVLNNVFSNLHKLFNYLLFYIKIAFNTGAETL